MNDFSAHKAAKDITIPVLVIHDENDTEVPVKCAIHIHKHLMNSELLLTQNLGHRKILGDKKVIEKINTVVGKNDDYAHIDLLLENIRKRVDNFKRIALSNSDGIHLFEISDIIRCESEDNYTKFYIKNSKPILISKTLKEYEDLLTEHGFERIHQSHLINIAYLKSYIKKDGGYVVMADDSNLPISQRKRDRLQELLRTL